MRIAISLDDQLAAQVRREAAAKGVSVSTFIASTLDDALKRQAPSAVTKPLRLVTVGGDGPHTGIELDRPRTIETANDEARFRQRGS